MEAFVVVLTIVVVLAAVAMYLVASYNGLIRSRTSVDESWSGVTVQLQRRADLIPNLVSTVQEYAQHEAAVFAQVTQARGTAASAQTPAQVGAAEPPLQSALRQLLSVAEQYPRLQSSQNFLGLQAELTDTEDKVSASRRIYNSAVRTFNARVHAFPNNLWSNGLGFAEREFFEVSDPQAIAAPPRVQF